MASTHINDGVFPIEHRNAENHITTLDYGVVGRLLRFTDPLDGSIDISYDDLNRRSQWVHSSGSEQKYEYKFGLDGLPTMILTSLRRFDPGNVPAGESEFIQQLKAYSPLGSMLADVEVTERLDNGADGGIRILSYSEYNRNQLETFRWTPYENPETIALTFSNGDIPKPTDDIGTSFQYDGLGRIVEERQPSGLVIENVYHSWGVHSDKTYARLDAVGSPNDKMTTCTRAMQRGDVIYGIVDENNCPAGLGHRFDRDFKDHLSAILLVGEPEPRTFKYDNFGRMEYQEIPGVSSFYSFYDAYGNPEYAFRYDRSQNFYRGAKTSFDRLNRPTEVWDMISSTGNVTEGPKLRSMVYDIYPGGVPSGNHSVVKGLLTEATTYNPHVNQAYKIVYGYNSRGEVLTHNVNHSNVDYVETFERTYEGVVRKAIDPKGVEAIYRLTPSMRILGVDMVLPFKAGPQSIISSVNYNPKGQLELIKYHSGGSQTNLDYDVATLFLRRITSVTAATGFENLQDLTMTYNGIGSITSINDGVTNTTWGKADRTGTFSYNNRDELISMSRYGETLNYSYNDAGAFIRNDDLAKGADLDQQHPTNVTRLIPRGSLNKPYVFDNAGNFRSGGKVIQAEFNSLGELISTETADSLIKYEYDHTGRRVAKRVTAKEGGAIVESLYPTKSIAVEPKDTQSYVFVGDQRLARVEHDKKKWYYYLKDHLGSSDIVMDEGDIPIEQMLYKAYGSEHKPEDIPVDGPKWAQHLVDNALLIPNERTHHRFTGQYLDDETGLYYYGARYYSPELGRFISIDIVFVDTPEACVLRVLECNLFGYAANNPMKNIDPTGEWIHVAIGAVVGGVLNAGAEALTSKKSGWDLVKDVAIAAGAGAAEGAVSAAIPGSGAARIAQKASKYGKQILQGGSSVAIGTAENKAKDPDKSLLSSATQSLQDNTIGFGVSKGLNKGAKSVTGSELSTASSNYKAGDNLENSAYDYGATTGARTKGQYREMSNMLDAAKELKTTGVGVGAGSQTLDKASSKSVNEQFKDDD